MSNLKDFIRLKQVGKGAFGTAWLVESKLTPKKYVIKELGHKEMSEREKTDARKEVMLLAKMNHRNIVTYFNSFEEGGRVHILMEYCENGDLGARIKIQNGIFFKEDQILDYFVQLCHGIKHIHDNKILHRDIKPQNVFLTKNNIVKLGDFGIAKLMNSTTAFTSTTVGTPFYFSPELCSRRMYNNKSDIWSLGCVLYELCTLNHAFSAQEMAILALRIKNVSYKPISQNYSSGLRVLISSIFQRDPRDRPNINEILKKPFISRVFEKNCPANLTVDNDNMESSGKYNSRQQMPRPVPVKEVTPRRESSVTPNRVNSGVNRKVTNKEYLIANSPYLPAAKKPMVRKQDCIKANALIIKKSDLAKKGRAAMIINDRENAWKNVLSSPNESNEANEQEVNSSESSEKSNAKPVGMYDNYYAELDRIKQQQEAREMEGRNPIYRFRRIQDDDIVDGVYRKVDQMKNISPCGVYAPDRDKVVLDYLENKQMAMYNKNRNGAGMALALGGARKIDPRMGLPSTPQNHDEEMSDRLNKIRQQNAEERKNQNVGDCALNFDKNRGMILNRENARVALEELQKKIKQRSDELHQRLALKRLEKDQEIDQLKKEEQNIKTPIETPNRLNNVVLFPKRADPFVPIPKPNIEISKVQDPRMTNVLDQLKNMKPSGDDVKIAVIQEFEMKLPSLSVVLNKLREEPLTPRPTTAPQPEKTEIKKIKTDILKRLNKNQILLDKVEESDSRKSWVMNYDDNMILKNENVQNLEDTIVDNNTMADVSALSDNELQSPRQKWSLDLNQHSNMAKEPEVTKPSWSQNNDLSINMMSELSEDTVGSETSKTIVEDLVSTVCESDTPDVIKESSRISVEDLLDEDVVEILSSVIDKTEEVSEPNQDVTDSTKQVITFEAWQKENDSKPVDYDDIVNNEDNDKSPSSLSSDDDRNEISMHMRKILEIKSCTSSEDEASAYIPVEDSQEEMENDARPVTQTRSLPNLDAINRSLVKKAMSESDLISSYNCRDSFDDFDGDEDFADDKSNDENIFLKIEMIRAKLETEIGLDPLIDAMEIVRESQDLDGDQVTAKLRDMLRHNEDAVNDIFHLVILEEQYNNMEE